MKRTLLLVFIMIMASVMPLLAAFCHNCGKELPGAANFCPACGKASAGAFQPAEPAPAAPVAVPSQPVSSPPVMTLPAQVYAPVIENSAIANYDYINQMELLLSNSSYSVASRQARELRGQHEGRMIRIEKDYRYFSAYQRKLHDLHLKKQKAVEDYLEAWKGTEYGSDRVRAMAEKDRALFVLSSVNEMIDTLLTGGGSLTSIARVEEMERRLHKTSVNYVVTAPYIIVDNQRLNRGEPIWVIDVVLAEAKVLHMGRGRSAQPVCGWVSIYDLEKRSSWRSDPSFFYSPPTTVIVEEKREPAIKVVIVGKDRYPYRHRRDRYDGKRDRHDDHHDDRRDDRHGKDRHDDNDRRGGDHRRYDYVVINPRFW